MNVKTLAYRCYNKFPLPTQWKFYLKSILLKGYAQIRNRKRTISNKPLFSYKDPYISRPISLADLHNAAEGIFLNNGNPYQPWIRKSPRFIDDPDHCGLFATLPDITFYYRQPFILSKKNITLVGLRTFLDQHKNWFNDQTYLEDEYNSDLERLSQSHNAYLNDFTGFLPTKNRATFAFDKKNRKEITLSGKTLTAVALEPNIYGSLIFRILPKLHMALRYGLKYDHVIVDIAHPRWLEFINLIGINSALLVQHDRHAIYHLEHALIPSMQNTHAYLDPITQQFYAELRQKHGLPQGKDKIYISRSQHNQTGKYTRILQNEAELVAALKQEGFKIVYPELLSAKQQIETFSAAAVVVGPAGSGLFNTVFCHPDTTIIDIESEPHWIFAHTSLFSSLNLDYGIFVGKSANPTLCHQPWSINVPALVSRIRSL